LTGYTPSLEGVIACLVVLKIKYQAVYRMPRTQCKRSWTQHIFFWCL